MEAGMRTAMPRFVAAPAAQPRSLQRTIKARNYSWYRHNISPAYPSRWLDEKTAEYQRKHRHAESAAFRTDDTQQT
jgi:hypothetical protein